MTKKSLRAVIVVLLIISVIFLLSARYTHKLYDKCVAGGDNVPPWFDTQLLPLFHEKIKKSKPELMAYCTLIVFYYCKIIRKAQVGVEFTWKSLETNIEQIQFEQNYFPDIVIGIKSGGAFLARYVQQMFQRRFQVLKPCHVELDYMRVTRYDKCEYDSEQTPNGTFLDKHSVRKAQLKTEPSVQMQNKRVLLVDDQSASGDTLRVAQNYCYGKGALNVKTMVITDVYHRADYRVTDRSWVVCWPWGCRA